MNKIVFVDLSNKKVSIRYIKDQDVLRSGRKFAECYINDNIKQNTKYLSEENFIVISPGLLTGTLAPCTGRLSISTKTNDDIKTINIAGPIAQKIASLDIKAIVITGKCLKGTSVLHVNENGVSLNNISETEYGEVEKTIDFLQNKWGKETSVLGIGPAGEHILPIGSLFNSYPNGTPKYHCTRGKIGDLFGYKGLKAIAVTTKKHFGADISDEDNFKQLTKKISKVITEHPVCGKALPAFGSITLIELMKDKNKFLQKLSSNNNKETIEKNINTKINKNCAPNCVIGCLNKHSEKTGYIYSSPAESEAVAACKNLFAIDDTSFVSAIHRECFEFGMDTIEFLFSCKMLSEVTGEKKITKAKIKDYLAEVKELTLVGRVLASTTKGIHNLYVGRKDVVKLVTRSAKVEEENFKIKIPTKPDELSDISDLHYLYGFMLVMESLGICLFTSFAILDDKKGLTLINDLVNAKTGQNYKEAELIYKALNTYNNDVPEFVKVLYRYYGEENENRV
ncbi:aldehyde ferredoxin oxidoreductase N-terminal domain-containing protein [Proteinivorax tanatarense]|uniref:Aldehyde ferredoxin oxidoreductase N-terminal domain-containing protein n=1 Tax=Proteinivorax tanatarense TaxID=1260629 RepID=A0AAU7VP98_9FIRM